MNDIPKPRLPYSVPIDVTETGNGDIPNAIYCTIPDELGSTDIELPDADGYVVTILEKICIQFEETVISGEGPQGKPKPKNRTIASRMSLTVKDSRYRALDEFQVPNGSLIKNPPDLWMKAELFLAANPQQTLVEIPLASLGRECGSKEWKNISKTTVFGPQPEILPQAHWRGILYFEYRNHIRCK